MIGGGGGGDVVVIGVVDVLERFGVVFFVKGMN